jgi:hypothetical protein
MKQKMTIYLLLSILLLSMLPAKSQSQDPSVVRFINSGKMYVGLSSAADQAVLYISNGVKMTNNSSILQNGITVIGGNFYQNSNTNVFSMDGNNNFTKSTGKIVFINDHDPNNRRISTRGLSPSMPDEETALETFSREAHYIAFPEIEIRTSDTIHIPAKMGIDAQRIIRSGIGKMRLESKSYAEGMDLKAYDAALRLTGNAVSGSSTLAPEGSVIVERDVQPYRIEDNSLGAGVLFAFASPMENLRSAYIAGNWVRKLHSNPAEYHHVTFVFGNETGQDGQILKSQYLHNPHEEFVAGRGYLLKLRKTGYLYEELQHTFGLAVTGANVSEYEKDKFIFDGEPYNLSSMKETKQLFARNVLFDSGDLNFNINKTINWIIGNSYSAPISIDVLKEKIESSALAFDPHIYVFPAGSTTYQVIRITGPDNGFNIIDVDQIPAMSYFMIRLDRNSTQNGRFVLNKNEILTHGDISHAMRSSKQYDNEMVFRISPVSNPNIYDLAGIALRENGMLRFTANDLQKVSSPEVFTIYTKSIDNVKLSANVIPSSTMQMPLYLSPGQSEGRFRMDVSRIESLQTEGLWLEDLIESTITNLIETDGFYEFNITPKDSEQRFIVHFQRPTGIESITSDLQMYFSKNRLIINGLDYADIGSTLRIVDMQGRIIISKAIEQQPEEIIEFSLPQGAYIARIEGKRNLTIKFIQ